MLLSRHAQIHSLRHTGGGGKIPRSLSPGPEVKPSVPQTREVVTPVGGRVSCLFMSPKVLETVEICPLQRMCYVLVSGTVIETLSESGVDSAVTLGAGVAIARDKSRANFPIKKQSIL